MASWIRFGDRLINLENVCVIRKICDVKNEEYCMRIEGVHNECIEFDFETEARLDIVYAKFMDAIKNFGGLLVIENQ